MKHIFLYSILILSIPLAKSQNCLLLQSTNLKEKTTSIKLLESITKEIENDVPISGIEFYFFKGGRDYQILVYKIDHFGNYTFQVIENGTIINIEKGTKKLTSQFQLEGEYKIICHPETIISSNYELLLIKSNESSLLIEGQDGRIIETLNNHKEFFRLPLEINELINKLI